jgi:hypothetical protein
MAMPNKFWLIAATAALAAAPAAAQNNAADEQVANAANEMTTTDANAVTANDTVDNAVEPVPAPTASDLPSQTVAPEDEDGDGFPWGLIGLVGLIGLLGRRHAS